MLTYDIQSVAVADQLLEDRHPIAVLHWDWIGTCVSHWLATF